MENQPDANSPAPAVDPPPAANSSILKRFRIPILILGGFAGMALCAVLTVGGILLYKNAATEKFATLTSQYDQADCGQVVSLGNDLTGFYQFGISSAEKDQAGAMASECKVIQEARDLETQKNFTDASLGYSNYLANYSQSKLFGVIWTEAQDAYLCQAEDLSGKNQYEDSLNVFKNILGMYPAAGFLTRAQNGYMDSYQKWVNSLCDQKDYEQAIGVCKDWTNTQVPESGTWCGQKAPSILWDWAQQLESEKKYADAIEKYQSLMTDYSTSTQASDAKTLIPGLYVNQGEALYATNKQEALNQFVEALKLVNSTDPIYLEIRTKYPEAFISYAAWQLTLGHFSNAMDILDQLIKENISPEVTDAAKTEYNLVVEALAGDTGAEGQAIMDQAYDALCANTVFKSPAINFFTERPGKAFFCAGGAGFYDSSLTATIPGELRYVVKFSQGSTIVKSCPYTYDHTLNLVQSSLSVEIRYAKDRTFYMSKTFLGGYPSACPDRRYFYSQVENQYGTAVGESEVQDWLNLVIK